MSHLFTCSDLSKTFGAKPLFENLSLSVHEEERIGLIGPNGAGKSTFIRILAGLETPESGELIYRKSLRIAYLPQTEQFNPDETVEHILYQATKKALPDYDRHSKVGEIMSVVGFEDGEKTAGTLSGGWKKRLAIATTLIQDPDLVLFDEPTNHLDLEGIIWLENFLQDVTFSFIVISHDRVFLENATNRTIEINRRYPNGFISVDGNYSEFLVRRDELLVQLHKQEQVLANTVRREVEWLRRMPKARTTKSSARIDRAEQMSADLAESRTRSQSVGTVDIDFTGTGRQSKQFVVAEKISKTFGDKVIFKNLTFALLRGTRLGLLGPNGSGKSTILKIFGQTLQPDSGKISWAPGLKIITFDQQRAGLNPGTTLGKFLAPNSDSVIFRDSTLHIVSYARKFRFQAEQVDTLISKLSGGEQARLLVAKLMLEPADLLLLDEPTNDLDIDTLQVLEENLISFPGAVILITHDRFMIENVSTHFLAIEDGETEFYASYNQWKSAQAENRKKKRKADRSAPAESKSITVSSLSPEVQKELSKLQKNIEKLEEQSQLLEAEMAELSPAAPSEKFTAACEKYARLKEQLDALYVRWQELES